MRYARRAHGIQIGSESHLESDIELLPVHLANLRVFIALEIGANRT